MIDCNRKTQEYVDHKGVFITIEHCALPRKTRKEVGKKRILSKKTIAKKHSPKCCFFLLHVTRVRLSSERKRIDYMSCYKYAYTFNRIELQILDLKQTSYLIKSNFF